MESWQWFSRISCADAFGKGIPRRRSATRRRSLTKTREQKKADLSSGRLKSSPVRMCAWLLFWRWPWLLFWMWPWLLFGRVLGYFLDVYLATAWTCACLFFCVCMAIFLCVLGCFFCVYLAAFFCMESGFPLIHNVPVIAWLLFAFSRMLHRPFFECNIHQYSSVTSTLT